MNALLVVNGNAGSRAEGDAVPVDEIVALLSAAGVRTEARVVPPAQLPTALRAAAAARPDMLIVGGGDGTISSAASCAAEHGVALGMLPLGTLNHFARDLGLPTDWREATEVLARGERHQIDVGEVNGHLFLNNCSLGSYPEAVRRREALRRTHGAGKWPAMALATFAVWRRLRRLHLRIETGGQALELHTPFVFIGNNRYTGHVLAQCGRECLDEGRLWIYTTRAHRRAALLRLVWQSLTRSLDDVDLLETHPFTEAIVTDGGHTALPIAADGEVLDVQLPLRLKVRPAALTVIAPAKERSWSRADRTAHSNSEMQTHGVWASRLQRPVVRSR